MKTRSQQNLGTKVRCYIMYQLKQVRASDNGRKLIFPLAERIDQRLRTQRVLEILRFQFIADLPLPFADPLICPCQCLRIIVVNGIAMNGKSVLNHSAG